MAALLGVGACTSSSLTQSGQSVGPVVWNGIDTRPLAVDSELRITFTSEDSFLCCGSGYAVASLDPEILLVQDLGGQQISLKGLAPGFTEVQVLSQSEVVGRVGVAVRTPTQIALADPSHLAAGIDVPLPMDFSIPSQGLELVTIQVLDDSNELLAFSPTLLTINSSGTIQAAAQGAETLAVAVGASGDTGCFDVELANSPDTSAAFNCGAASHNGWPVFRVTVVEAPASVAISTRALPVTEEQAYTALATAHGADGITEVLSVVPWSFSLAGNQGILVPIATAATKIVFSVDTPDHASSLSVTDGTIRAVLPVPP